MTARVPVLVVLILAASTAVASAAQHFVPGDFPTIQAAIDDPGTVAGDVITLTASPWSEGTILVTKGVTIEGGGIGATELQSASIGIRPQADGITVRDLTITGGSQHLRFEMAGGTISDFTLERVSLEGFSCRGIELHNATTLSGLTVIDSTFSSAGAVGMRVSSSGHLEGASFTGCTFVDSAYGFYHAEDGGDSSARDVTFTGCRFERCSAYALFFEELQDAWIEGNDFVDNYRDVQIFQWYNAPRVVSNVQIRDNSFTGTTNAVFSIFNAHHVSGQTVFDDVRFESNTLQTAGGSYVYAGGHSNYQSADPSLGGLGWDTVSVSCNSFDGALPVDPDDSNTGGVRYWAPAGVADADSLGGAVLDVSGNWWGTADPVQIEALIEFPAITDTDPPLASAADAEIVPCGDGLLFDLRPNNTHNQINTGAKQLVPFAVLGSAGFDPCDLMELDPETILVRGASPISTRTTCEDVNGDGFLDLSFKIRARDLEDPTEDECNDPDAMILMTASNPAGNLLSGTDHVTWLGCD